MLAAVREGDAKKVAQLIRQDPGFNVNKRDRSGYTLLHRACIEDSRSAVIPLLLAHPDIDVNDTDVSGSTPFYCACNERPSCVREMLKDSRVNVNKRNIFGHTPLWRAAYMGHLDIIKLCVASGRKIDLGTLGDTKTDAIGVAKKKGKTEVVTLLERFKKNPDETRHIMRVELGFVDNLAADMFALVVFVSDGLLQINPATQSPTARFFSIAVLLPMELQMILCYHASGSAKEIIPCKESELAFKDLARKLL